MTARRGKRELTDLVVSALLEHDTGEWVSGDALSGETGIPLHGRNNGLYARCRFLELEYGLVRTAVTTARRAACGRFVVQLLPDRLADYEEGTCRNRPGRRHAEEYLWPGER